MYKAILLNDTRRDFGHAGCYEVIENIFYLCKVNKIKIKKSFMSDNLSNSRSYESSLNWADCLIVNGEGSLHDDNQRTMNILRAIKQAKLKGLYVVLVNSLWLNNKLGVDFLTYIDFIVCRDDVSFNEVKRHHNNVFKTYDFSLYTKGKLKDNNNNNNKMIITDSSDKMNNILLKKLSLSKNKKISYMNFNEISFLSNDVYKKNRIRFIRLYDLLPINVLLGNVLNYLVFLMPKILKSSTVKKSRFIISGRFHGIMLSVKYKKPFMYVPASNDKIDLFLSEANLDKSLLKLKNVDFNNDSDFKIKMHEVESYFKKEGFDLLSDLIYNNNKNIESVFVRIRNDLDNIK